MRSKSQDIFEIEETYRDDEVLEYLKFSPSKAQEELGDLYFNVEEGTRNLNESC